MKKTVQLISGIAFILTICFASCTKEPIPEPDGTGIQIAPPPSTTQGGSIKGDTVHVTLPVRD